MSALISHSKPSIWSRRSEEDIFWNQLETYSSWRRWFKMRHAFKFNIIKFSSWTSLTVGVCAWTTEITIKGFVKISHRLLITELTTGQTLFRGQNVTVALHQPSWTMLQRNMSSPIFCKSFKSWTLLVSLAWRMSVLLCSVAAPMISLKICIHSLVFSLSCSL